MNIQQTPFLDPLAFHPTPSLFIHFHSKFLFKCWHYSFFIHSLGGLICSYYFMHDLNTQNPCSNISAQTFPLGSRLVYPNTDLIPPLARLRGIQINVSEVELLIYLHLVSQILFSFSFFFVNHQ